MRWGYVEAALDRRVGAGGLRQRSQLIVGEAVGSRWATRPPRE